MVIFTVNILAFLRLKINLFSIVLLFSYKKTAIKYII